MMNGGIDMAHSELRALVTKAARGAGLTWGHAEEAGWAADWLARRALPAGAWAAVWLAAALKGQPGPIETGLSLADRFANGHGPFPATPLPDNLPAPGYLLPFLHLIATHHGLIHIEDPLGTVVQIDPTGTVTFGPSWSARSVNWQITTRQPQLDTMRTRLGASLIECLDGLALRTTVPPSAASRLNAGAPTTDDG